MPNYSLTAVNIGSFSLGESDKVLTLFSAERGLSKAVAKGARKPGAKVAGRADVLNVNRLFLATGKTLDIITQAEAIENFAPLRSDLARLAYGLYYAELTVHFGQGLAEESAIFFDMLCQALARLASDNADPVVCALEFSFGLLALLGYQPELTFCVHCRQPLTDYTISAFDHDAGGTVCQSCSERKMRRTKQGVREEDDFYDAEPSFIAVTTQLTPLVWKRLILAAHGQAVQPREGASKISQAGGRALHAAQKLMQTYIEQKAGRKMKSLDLLGSLSP